MSPRDQGSAIGAVTPRGSLITISHALSGAVARLPNSPTARLDAELLMAHVLGTSRSVVLTHGIEPLDSAAQSTFESLVGRRAAGEPVAYVTGRCWFYGLELIVSPEVLIPRPETELLVEWALKRLRHRDPDERTAFRVLDVGTGSGAIALAIAAHRPSAQVHATDISAAALNVARTNAVRLGLADAITWHEADLWPDGIDAFDLVVANLPYVGTDEVAMMDAEVVLSEPHVALFAGSGGLDVIRRFLASARPHLAAHSADRADLGLEIGWHQGDAMRTLAATTFPEGNVRIRQDLAGRDRMATVEGIGRPG